MRERFAVIEDRLRNFERTAAAAGVLLLPAAGVLAGCGETRTVTKTVNRPIPATTASGHEPTITVPVPSQSSTSQAEGITMVFDDLDARYPTIEVYPGPKNTYHDRQYNAIYKDGEPVTAECKTEGRFVHSVPPEHPNRRSNEWIRIHSVGEPQYATAVYIEHPQKILSELPNC